MPIENKNGVILIDVFARVTTQCDNCKQSIDTSKPKKGKDGKEADPNPAVQATLPANADSVETKDFHFCDTECLYQFLHKRYKK